jgi:acyl-coenzyme A thioesterase PaaI-like protein
MEDLTRTPIQHLYPENVSHCFGCGHAHPHGHHFETVWDEEADEGVTRFTPDPGYTSMPGYVYGGLIASILDCHGIGTAAAAVRRARGPGAPLRYVTGSLHVDFVAPTPLGPELVARGKVVEMGERKVVVDVRLLAGEVECARGRVVAVRLPDTMRPT